MQVEYKKTKENEEKPNGVYFEIRKEKRRWRAEDDDEIEIESCSFAILYTKKREKESHFIDFVDDNRLFSLSLSARSSLMIEKQNWRTTSKERERGEKTVPNWFPPPLQQQFAESQVLRVSDVIDAICLS